MVFMKKAKGKPKQKVQGKDFDEFQNSSFLDSSDGESDDDVIVAKTPKGKQSLGEKRVSFQVPGKNTPAKTPGKNTPAKTPVGKKQATPAKGKLEQATPGKGGLQKFKGMPQQKQNSKKGPQPEDDDDDDDDDDSDEDDSDMDGDFDLRMDEDDDDEDDDDEDEGEDEDDEDEDDDDDDEDDDDDDEDDEEIDPKLSPKNQKQKLEQAKQALMKANQKASAQAKKSAETPKKTPLSKSEQSPKAAETPKSEIKQIQKNAKKENNSASPTKANSVQLLEEERRRERDAKQLYMGNLPKDVVVDEIQELSSDIISATIHVRPKSSRAFAFLQFASEEKAEENLKLLKSKQLRGTTPNVDYTGSKSSKQIVKPVQYDPKRLVVSGLPLDVTIHQVSKFFPTCHTVALNQSKTYRTATIVFWTEDDANAAFSESANITLRGVKLSVLHTAVSRNLKNKRKKAPKKNKGKDNGHPNKKMKLMKEE